MAKTKGKNQSFFTNKKFSDFICDFEDKWLQYATADERMKAFFGNRKIAIQMYQKWKKGNDIFVDRRFTAFSKNK